MNAAVESITVRAGKKRVFDAYVQHIDQWWPRTGKYRYTFAPEDVGPKHIRFEQKLGGRFYETFADDTEYEIGRITVWDPHDRLTYTWQDRRWTYITTVDVRFEAVGEQTRVTVTHAGFGEAKEAEGYTEGLAEIMGEFKAWLHTQEGL